ncbi:siderophore-interacting protein [Agrococcus jejuensis]|uniref:NADPH-dependent ferric siderophore reductase, contains FAD-binding and SIP domains n=1 Tax=Agrococcus jejuensis TaxID=399736 RepID=A0A1G8AHD9_9MICO|nr:siderophore-interacting protein [Agrococcus jejuensis]SDH20425.1 NADPH-dependent ferric siderophore reductase, contains FAD-binding and SIP domains [Agrococcus jejuensis]
MAGPARVAAVAPRFIDLEVLGNEQISPHLRRVTLGGEDVANMTPQGYDQWFRFFMRRPDQDALQVPTSPKQWFPQYLLMSEAKRPHIRNYTIRAFRRDVQELDIDFVVHEDPGPGAQWSIDAKVGERAALLDEGLLYNDDGVEGDVLMVGDESVIPAIAGVCGSIDRATRGIAVIEVGHMDDVQDLGQPDGIDVHWIHRGSEREGQAGLRALSELDLPGDIAYAYAAGEQSLATGARRHLVKHRGVDKANVTFTGYWRLGKAYVS